MWFCTLFTPGFQTFRDERRYISLSFYSKTTPLCPSYQSKNNDEVITIIGVPFTVLTFEVNREFKQWRFWATLVNQKLAFFFLICLGTTKFVLLSVFTLKETICLKICSKSRLKSAQSPLSVDVRRSKTENRIYSSPREVVSKIILFVYSLRGALIKIARGCHTRWRNYFDGTGWHTLWRNYFDLTIRRL